MTSDARKIAEQIAQKYAIELERHGVGVRPRYFISSMLTDAIEAALTHSSGYRAGIEDAAKVAEEFRNSPKAGNPYPTIYGAIAEEIRALSPTAEPAPEPEGMETTEAERANWRSMADHTISRLARDFDRFSRSRDVASVVRWLRLREGEWTFEQAAVAIETGEPWKDRT